MVGPESLFSKMAKEMNMNSELMKRGLGTIPLRCVDLGLDVIMTESRGYRLGNI